MFTNKIRRLSDCLDLMSRRLYLFIFVVLMQGITVPVHATSTESTASFSVQLSAANVNVGDILDVRVSIGDPSYPLRDITGIGFELHQQSDAFSLQQIVWHDFPGRAAEVIRFSEIFPGTANYGLSVVRSDGSGRDGAGFVATLQMRLDRPLDGEYTFELRNPLVVNSNGTRVDVSLPEEFRVQPGNPQVPLPDAVILVNPVNGEVDVELSPTFTWTSVGGTSEAATGDIRYEFNLARDANFSIQATSILTEEVELTISELLQYNSTYFWRVRAINETGAGPWSAVWIFGTIPEPQPPTRVRLITPSNQQIDVSILPRFEWEQASNTDFYEIEVATDPSFGNVTILERVNAQFFQTGSPLAYETVYFWRVRAFNNTGAGPWSLTRIFSTQDNPLPSRVFLIAPANGSANVSVTPVFSWAEAIRADTYEIQYSSTSDFEGDVTTAITEQLSYSATEPLDYETVYFWRVRALNDVGVGLWSPVRIFSTEIKPLPPPQVILSEPLNRASDVSRFPEIVWQPAFSATSYEVEIATSPGFDTDLIQFSLSQTRLQINQALDYETTYFWRVRALNDNGSSPWSGIRVFTTEVDPTPQPPARVLLLSPVNQAVNVSINPLLEWAKADGASSYEIELAGEPTFTTVLEQAMVEDTEFRPLTSLSYDGVLFWRVRAVNEAGPGEWSLIRIFFTETDPSPGNVVLSTPPNGQFGVSITPQLAWLPAINAQAYEVQVSATGTFADVTFSQLTNDLSVVVDPALAYETTWFWRVRAVNQNGNGAWSTVRIFTTQEAPELPGRVQLTTPENQSGGVVLRPTFSWLNAPFATLYEILVSDDPTFIDNAIERTTSSNSFSAETDLSPGTLYFWKVRGINDNGEGEWSIIRIFTTHQAESESGFPLLSDLMDADTRVTLISPANGSESVASQPTLSWSVVNEADFYEITVSSSALFPEGSYTAQTSDISYTLSQSLPFESSWFWRVRAVVNGEPQTWSRIWLFTTEGNPLPTRVVLNTPDNQAENVHAVPALAWLEAERAETYTIQLSKDAAFLDGIVESVITSTVWSPEVPLNYSTQYYWRVRASNTAGVGDWSATRLFTVENDPNPPPAIPGIVTLLSPTNGDVGVTVMPVLSWNASPGAVSYQIELSVSSGFGESTLSFSTTELEKHVTSTLAFETIYYWRVRAINETGEGSWSSVRIFTTQANPVPVIVKLGAPANGATDADVRPVFAWNAATSAQQYTIHVSSSPAFESLLESRTVSELTYELETTLAYSSTYYWRVRGVNGDLNGPWSTTRILTTIENPVPAVPDRVVLQNPLAQANGVDILPVFSWSAALRAVSYIVEVSEGPSFDTLVFSVESEETSFQVSESLKYETTYYWRVRAVNNGGNGPWSIVRLFTTAQDPAPAPVVPSPVVLSSPLNGALDVPVLVVFAWQQTEGANSYELQFAQNATFTNGVVSVNVASTSHTVTQALPFEQLIYWRVRAINDVGNGEWSPVWIFTTETDPEPAVELPSRVRLLSPPNLAENLSRNVTLEWAQAVGATAYDYELSLDASFVDAAQFSGSTSDTTFIPPASLIYGTRYFWRVRGDNVSGNGDWSPTWTFVTEPDPATLVEIPGRVILDSPTNGNLMVALLPTFRWKEIEDAEIYEFQLSVNPSFDSLLVEISLPELSYKLISELDYRSTYFWRVRASNIAGTGDWSISWSFSTIPIIRKFALLSPSDGFELRLEGDVSDNIEITWEQAVAEISGEVSYTFYLLDGVEADTSDALLSISTGTQNRLVLNYGDVTEALGLTQGQLLSLFWTVHAKIADVSIEAEQRFGIDIVVGLLTSVETTVGLPSTFVLYQNYPNPFNPTTRISYELPEQQHVTLIVYDLLGRQIATLVNEIQTPGVYHVQWDAGGVSSGMYLFRMKAGNFVATRRMLLVK
jgi:predicted phage tail protein